MNRTVTYIIFAILIIFFIWLLVLSNKGSLNQTSTFIPTTTPTTIPQEQMQTSPSATPTVATPLQQVITVTPTPTPSRQVMTATPTPTTSY